MSAVSVIIPTYNTGHYLAEAIQSVLNQSFENFEVIVVNDGSTDNTTEVVKGFDDPRICYLYQENQGLSSARNTGISIATGDYLVFLDADDLLQPNKLADQATYLDQYFEVGLVAGGWIYIDEEGGALGEHTPWVNTPDLDLENLLYICPFVPNSIMVRRHWVEQVGFFDESLSRVEDWDLWLRLIAEGCIMNWLKVTVCKYRIRSHSLSRSAIAMKNGTIQTLEKFYQRLDPKDPLQLKWNLVLSHGYLRGFSRELIEGEFDEARRDLERAIQLNPNLIHEGDMTVADYIIATATGVNSSNSEGIVADALSTLPNQLNRLRPKLNGYLRMHQFYTAYGSEDWQNARRAFVSAVRQNPSWLLNRGTVRMWLDTLIGRERVDRLLNLAGRRVRLSD
jgi:glycosyltransferase involved in cell wall biosynthesis